jgi:hypothetical protein
MTQDLAHQLVVSGLLLENDGAGGVPELVRGNPQAREPEDTLGDLAAEGDFALGAASQPGLRTGMSRKILRRHDRRALEVQVPDRQGEGRGRQVYKHRR